MILTPSKLSACDVILAGCRLVLATGIYRSSKMTDLQQNKCPSLRYCIQRMEGKQCPKEYPNRAVWETEYAREYSRKHKMVNNASYEIEEGICTSILFRVELPVRAFGRVVFLAGGS